MKVNEYGSEHKNTVAVFQCAAELFVFAKALPKPVCRLIALKDWVMVMLGTKSFFHEAGPTAGALDAKR